MEDLSNIKIKTFVLGLETDNVFAKVMENYIEIHLEALEYDYNYTFDGSRKCKQ